ncbi:TPA: hypothetical protein R4Y95_004714 [Klebsiella variicola subsp. variicola]|nr:hypothetical protein [Klebsiella variicola subsp. variicola]
MNARKLLLSFFFITDSAFCGVQSVDFTYNVLKTVDQRVNEVNDQFEYIVNNLNFSIDSSNPMPGARTGWVNGVPVMIFTSSLIDVVFYTTELTALYMADNKWEGCYNEYSEYLRSSYSDMMMQMQNYSPLSHLIPPEKYGYSCSGINKYYPFDGWLKAKRDQSAANAIAFIYLHELSHLFYRHEAIDTKNMSDLDRQDANCKTRKMEKDADILAARKLVKFGWERSALDTTTWMVMLNTGVIETSRNGNLDHPTALERMSYTLDEVRGAIISSGGQVSREMSEAIDEAKALVKKADKQLGAEYNSELGIITCDN